MKITREKVLLVAMKLFAKDGYSGVSMSMIARESGVTRAALYRYNTDKEDIFDSIVAWMIEKNLAHLKKFDTPIDSFEKVKEISMEIFKYWTEDCLASNFRKMLTLEQYRNPNMVKLLSYYMFGDVANYFKDLMNKSTNSDKDAEVLTLEYFAPIYTMMSLYDHLADKEYALSRVEKHVDYFVANRTKSGMEESPYDE